MRARSLQEAVEQLEDARDRLEKAEARVEELESRVESLEQTRLLGFGKSDLDPARVPPFPRILTDDLGIPPPNKRKLSARQKQKARDANRRDLLDRFHELESSESRRR